ncbi:MAG: hypothetical protein IPL70_00335 [Uliginosibacterium sp.]|jgi:hypothetical protein|nr:hypothetical protein [Uliginosibacterium sp.]
MFVSVAVPQTESELCVMVSLLEAHEIPYFVFNRGFGGLYPGMHMHLYNNQKIMVHAAQAREAFELLGVFRSPVENFEALHKLRWQDKLRVLVELFLGNWCFPSRRRTLNGDAESEAPAAPASSP